MNQAQTEHHFPEVPIAPPAEHIPPTVNEVRHKEQVRPNGGAFQFVMPEAQAHHDEGLLKKMHKRRTMKMTGSTGLVGNDDLYINVIEAKHEEVGALVTPMKDEKLLANWTAREIPRVWNLENM